MAATFEAVTSHKTVEKQAEKSEAEAARELVRMAREQGLSLTGPEGLLKQLPKTVSLAVWDLACVTCVDKKDRQRFLQTAAEVHSASFWPAPVALRPARSFSPCPQLEGARLRTY